MATEEKPTREWIPCTKHDDPCLAKADDDEPLFVLRAQDEMAPLIVERWANLAQANGASVNKCHNARKIAAQMRDWQREHPDRVKLPD